MITFFTKRILTSALVVLLSTLIMFYLVSWSIDPLEDLRGSTAPNKAEQMAARAAQLNLDDPIFVRYLDWLKGASGCLYGDCDLGTNWRTGRAVTDLLAGAITTTLQLVVAATI